MPTWFTLEWLFVCLFVLICFSAFSRQVFSVYSWLYWNLLCRWGWPQSHRDPPDSTSWVLWSKVCQHFLLLINFQSCFILAHSEFFFFKGEESQWTGRNRKIMIAIPHPCVLFLIVFANDWLRMIGTRTHGRAGETQEISVTCVWWVEQGEYRKYLSFQWNFPISLKLL